MDRAPQRGWRGGNIHWSPKKSPRDIFWACFLGAERRVSLLHPLEGMREILQRARGQWPHRANSAQRANEPIIAGVSQRAAERERVGWRNLREAEALRKNVCGVEIASIGGAVGARDCAS